MNDYEHMEDLERELTRALRPVDPPETLGRSVMLRVEAEERRLNSGKSARAENAAATDARFKSPNLRMRAWFAARVWAGSALAAILVLGIFAGEQMHARHHRERAEVAQQQFETAMQITGQALDQTRKQLAQAGLRFAE